MIQGGSVLLLLSVFFAYLLAPAVDIVSRTVRLGRRGRPIARGSALLLIYTILFVPVALAWRFSGEPIAEWVVVTAPDAVEHLFGGGEVDAIDRVIAGAPVPPSARAFLTRRVDGAVTYIKHEAKDTLEALIDAAPYAAWLLVTPVLAFLLLTGLPAFRRSTLRVLPHGHLQWRGEEYLHDVNSALAGYVRAQVAAGVVVGVVCVCGFALLGVPSAVSMGVAAGILELVPAIGPLTALLIAVSQAGERVLPVIAFLGALRVAQDYIIYPRLVRRGMHLSTPVVILTVWIGAALAGAAGVILAIPVAGFLSVSLRHWREYRDIEGLLRSTPHQVVRQQSDRAEQERQHETRREE